MLLLKTYVFKGVDEKGEINSSVTVKEIRVDKAIVSKLPEFTNEIEGLQVSDFEVKVPAEDIADDIYISLGSWQVDSARFGGSDKAPAAKIKNFSLTDFLIQMGEEGGIFC